jgi:serine/arginine repetitive matrix protein 1
MDIDGGGLKIKGQAEAQRRRSKWEDDSARDGPSGSSQSYGKSELEKRENELKEKALRNKVVRTRKGSNGAS